MSLAIRLASGSSVPDRSTGDPSMNNEVQARCEARTDREQPRSSVPDDLREPHRQDETRRTVDLGHSSDGPSWIDLAENRVNTTESPFEVLLNRLLQQNLPKADIRRDNRLLTHQPPRTSQVGSYVIHFASNLEKRHGDSAGAR